MLLFFFHLFFFNDFLSDIITTTANTPIIKTPSVTVITATAFTTIDTTNTTTSTTIITTTLTSTVNILITTTIKYQLLPLLLAVFTLSGERGKDKQVKARMHHLPCLTQPSPTSLPPPVCCGASWSAQLPGKDAVANKDECEARHTSMQNYQKAKWLEKRLSGWRLAAAWWDRMLKERKAIRERRWEMSVLVEGEEECQKAS